MRQLGLIATIAVLCCIVSVTYSRPNPPQLAEPKSAPAVATVKLVSSPQQEDAKAKQKQKHGDGEDVDFDFDFKDMNFDIEKIMGQVDIQKIVEQAMKARRRAFLPHNALLKRRKRAAN